MRRSLGILCLVGILTAGTFASAQQKVEVRAADPRPANADEQLAAVILAGCHNEVAVAQFAKPLLKSAEAKEFAERMIQDHQAACDKLQKLAGSYTRAHGREATATDPAAPTEQKAKLEVGRLKLEASQTKPKVEGEARTGAFDWVSIQQQIADQCLASVKSELQRNDNKDVDACYIGMQIAAHMKMVDELKVFQRYASASMRGQIDSSLEMSEAHLKQAKSIMETLAKASSK